MEYNNIRFLIFHLKEDNEVQKKFHFSIFHRFHRPRRFKCPYDKLQEINLMGKNGAEIELPYTKDEACKLKKDQLEQYIQGILDRFDIASYYMRGDKSICNIIRKEAQGWLFSYLFLKQGLNQLLKEYEIPKQRAKYCVIDSGTRKIQVVLECIMREANYLTIVTDREEYFQNVVEAIYEETGLLVAVEPKEGKSLLLGNVIINLDGAYQQLYARVREPACVIEMDTVFERLECLGNIKKEISILVGYEISSFGKTLDIELMAEIIVRTNWKANQFIKREYGVLSEEEMERLIVEYGLKVEGFKVFSLLQ